MKKLLTFLFAIMSLGLNAQNDLPNNCLDCAIAQGFYCGEDPSNWTMYSPNGCVPDYYINDGYEDCVDATDEGADVVPTTIEECPEPVVIECDTVYVDVPVIEYIYETIYVDVPIIEFYIKQFWNLSWILKIYIAFYIEPNIDFRIYDRFPTL